MPRPTAPSVTAAEKDARALELRRAGLSYRQIAAQMGVSVGAAWKYVTRGLDRTRREPADALRDLEAERLDQLQLEALRVLRRRHFLVQAGEVVTRRNPDTGTTEELLDDGPTLAAIRTLLAVQERRARLLGLDAPAKLDARVDLRVAWERASREERLSLIDLAIVDLEAELAQQGPPTPPSAETITPPSGPEPDPEILAAAMEAALDAAGVPPDRREAAYQAVEQHLLRRAMTLAARFRAALRRDYPVVMTTGRALPAPRRLLALPAPSRPASPAPEPARYPICPRCGQRHAPLPTPGSTSWASSLLPRYGYLEPRNRQGDTIALRRDAFNPWRA